MPAEKEIRKLAAIMHADVKGYSRLMGEDESHTVRALRECRMFLECAPILHHYKTVLD